MIFFIVTEDLSLYGTYESEFKKNTIYDWPEGAKESGYIHLPLPEGLDQDCIKAVLVDEIITLVEDPALVAAKALALKQAQVAELKAASDKDILDGMAALYGTTNETSATATYLTWQDMWQNSSSYVGSVFPDASAVTAYVTAKLEASRAYAKFRMERMEQFKIDKAAILNG